MSPLRAFLRFRADIATPPPAELPPVRIPPLPPMEAIDSSPRFASQTAYDLVALTLGAGIICVLAAVFGR